jgi:HlyD family secretion protein
MPLLINLGAISDKSLQANLRFVSPQGVEEQGAVQFKIEAELTLDSSVFVRAGYSANATIVLGKTNKVLAIREALVQYDEETEEPFVEVEIGEQKFERKTIELGISDGINVEIKSGITAKDKVKVWSKTEPMKKNEEKK